MGFFDWLFGRKSKKTASAPKPAAPPVVDDDDDDVDPSEQTTFVSVRLSPAAQVQIKKLRDLKEQGATRYRWEVSPDACGDCQTFAGKGEFDIALGLSRAAPVPGRDTNCDCNTNVVAAD